MSITDLRIVYGARCTWWDSIDNVGRTPPGPGGHRLPACPHCGSVLFEVPTEEDWWEGVDRAEREGRVGYRGLIEWSRGRCYPNFTALEAAYGERVS